LKRLGLPRTIIFQHSAIYGDLKLSETEGIKFALRLQANRVLQEWIGHSLNRPNGRAPNAVQQSYANFSYQAGSWTKPRRVVAKSFFTTWAPHGTTIEALAKIEGHRWAIEDGFETAKNELGLDHNETRSWHGWHRHVSLVMLAFAMMAKIRVHANSSATPTPKKSDAQ